MVVTIVDSTDRLLWEAIRSLANQNGDSQLEPLSLSLLCLDFGISWDEKEEIIGKFHAISNEELAHGSAQEIIDIFRKALNDVLIDHPPISDLTVYSFIRAVAKEYIDRLYPISSFLKSHFSITADLDR